VSAAISILAIDYGGDEMFRALESMYLDRLSKFSVRLQTVLSKGARKCSGFGDCRKAESELLLQRCTLKGGASQHLVALDQRGRQMSSEEFASYIQKMLAGYSKIYFLVGGVEGHDPNLLDRTDGALSLGKMTLPHKLARVVLLEQLYRAYCITCNHRYHR